MIALSQEATLGSLFEALKALSEALKAFATIHMQDTRRRAHRQQVWPDCWDSSAVPLYSLLGL